MTKKEKHEKAKQIVSHFLDNADYWSENEYDEDDEWVSGGDDWAFSQMPTLDDDKEE